MTPMGERIGTRIAQSKRLPVIYWIVFHTWLHHYDIGTGSAGAGRAGTFGIKYDSDPGSCRRSWNLSGGCCTAYVIFKPLSYMLLIFYPVVFILTFFVSKDFLAIAFDSGGVTTGPMTVPFIMALGIGFSAVRSDKYAETDSFGLVSLCSIGRCWRYCFLASSIIHRAVVILKL